MWLDLPIANSQQPKAKRPNVDEFSQQPKAKAF
jgi:hypothetical protein